MVSTLLRHETEIAGHQNERQRFLRDVIDGLGRAPKSVPCRYFYDEPGTRLFEEISALPEYYLHRCERDILAARKGDIVDRLGREPLRLLDLGSGNGSKARILIEHFREQGALLGYFPVDISAAALRAVEDGLAPEFPGLNIEPIRDSYLAALRRFRPEPEARKLLLFLGSSIGNFEPDEETLFLKAVAARLNPGDGFLIGFDLRKSPERILRAYNDEAGITARFNRNLLERINRELGGDFQPDRFGYRAEYDAEKGMVRSHLVSLESQRVHIGAASLSFRLERGEAIHTENSRKFDREDIRRMAAECGFTVEAEFEDAEGGFVDCLWLPAEPRE